MKEISQKTIKELTCLCGLCEHEVYDKTCPYAKILDHDNVNELLFDRIIKLMRKEITENAKRKPKTNRTVKTTKRK